MFFIFKHKKKIIIIKKNEKKKKKRNRKARSRKKQKRKKRQYFRKESEWRREWGETRPGENREGKKKQPGGIPGVLFPLPKASNLSIVRSSVFGVVKLWLLLPPKEKKKKKEKLRDLLSKKKVGSADAA